MSTFFWRKCIFLIILLPLLISCASTDQGIVNLSDYGTEQVIQQSDIPADSDPAGSSGSGGQIVTTETFDISAWKIHIDEVYAFKVAYPEYYAIKTTQENERIPVPLITTHFTDTRSELAAIAPPVFSIRVYDNAEQQSLGAWLKSNDLNNKSEWINEPYKGVYFSGIKVLSTTYMSPGEFIYIAWDKWIFELTPVGAEANVMLDTFEFTQ